MLGPAPHRDAPRWRSLAATLSAFLLRDARVASSYRAVLLLRVLDPLVALAGSYFYAKLVPSGGPLTPYGGDYFGFALLGMVVMQLHVANVTSPGTRLREEMLQGTLEVLHVSTRGPEVPILGSMAFPGLLSVVQTAFLFAAGMLLGARWCISIPELAGVLLATTLAFVSWGLLASAAVLLLQKAAPVTWVISILTTVLSGVFYPVSVMPAPLQAAAQALPATAAMEGLRRAMLGGTGSAWASVLVLLGFSAFCLPLGVVCVRLATRRARRLGALGTY